MRDPGNDMTDEVSCASHCTSLKSVLPVISYIKCQSCLGYIDLFRGLYNYFQTLNA